ncbi:uncharacterized protein SPAPADRAFT_61241 [Spathaspora passalidarum NRRL Y-27907]|uniref:Uncharacterized protein n=1 Tax=Spathaspora passalidarum (strain NRRL Y-27907 / 11-Y1) TaxID=619300 RepID=G3API7_SPAPN|nr:uncharacterized protein SPAPADRAFT_61241 [Spathaspora passalidarum NRRL Y-27907]EGW32158.1 hypothetical protein SPAPADRAFT_61241 [Spathaspora passalidarum NRRL Y-27907]
MSEQPEVAPYGGFITRTLDVEKEREEKLKEQAIEVNVNSHTEIIRPEAIYITGVDSLSTDDIKAFVDYYLNYNVIETVNEDETKNITYEPLPFDDQIQFKVEWINDSSVNIRFDTHEESAKALHKISITQGNPDVIDTDEPPVISFTDPQYINNIIQLRESKPYTPVIQFRKQQSLVNRLGVKPEAETESTEKTENTENAESAPVEESAMEEDESSVVLYTRQSFQSDRKVKNAAQYSRYYLIHGEPERKPYRKHKRRREPKPEPVEEQEPEEDLFADRLSFIENRKSREPSARAEQFDNEEDLFADKLRQRERSRSPVRSAQRSNYRHRSNRYRER